jgi:hypothetical protein
VHLEDGERLLDREARVLQVELKVLAIRDERVNSLATGQPHHSTLVRGPRHRLMARGFAQRSAEAKSTTACVVKF